jgi:transglutaminase-like putative cysteine protease
MRLSDRQFNLVAVTALAAIAPHLGRLPLWLGMALILVAPLRMFARRQGAKPVSAWWRVPLVAVLVAVIILQYGNIFGREPGSALAAGLLMLKLIESERIRDARAALGFSAFVLMSALLFTQTLGFTLILCASLILLLAALNSLEPAALDNRPPLRAELRVGALLFGLGLPLAVAAFMFIPRLGTPLWGAPGMDRQARTGLDERMAPGSLTELLLDDTPALRARFDGDVPKPAARYFRALVLWDFDGSAWTRENATWQPTPEPAKILSASIEYEITLEPTDRPWLVALDLPLTAPENTRITSDRTLIGRSRITLPRQYRASSAISYELATTLDPKDRRRALTLPDGFNAKTRALATQWRSEGRDDAAIVRGALDLFHASFTYTLSPPLLGRDSVDDFLFDTRAGYCEHYSSAFVFLMRSAGIPARVVTGYQGGWWNQLGQYLLVRQSDAHAWSEVWLENRGWVRVDPTAAVSPARIESGAAAVNGNQAWFESSWLFDLRNRLDVVNRLWTQTIVQFSALRQKSLLTPFGIDQAEQGDLLLALACIVAFVMLIATIWVLRTGRVTHGDALDASWTRLRRTLAKRGIEPRSDEGPLDYLVRLQVRFPGAEARIRLADLVKSYVELRYATREPPAERVRVFARAVRELRLPRTVNPSD